MTLTEEEKRLLNQLSMRYNPNLKEEDYRRILKEITKNEELVEPVLSTWMEILGDLVERGDD